jgi:diaminohydroxyphosphoribosylaminopyrimidine deaminase/5-amino-6-(5-phosphoribosylamino)uracil reductase
MSEIDLLFMRRCIEIAQLSAGMNRPNPEVGSIIVHHNKIIGEGWHAVYGSAHAEVNAINSVQDKSLLRESCLYVTLEPCFHFGKTAPCVDLILKHHIPRVVIGCRDPYHEVAGQSIEKLKKAGVDVITGVLEKEVAWLNRRFFCNVQKKRPYIVLKFAVSSDGFMGISAEQVQISGPMSKSFVHKLRANEAAVMVGTETAACDNPQLNLRYYFGEQPTRVVFDKNLRLPESLNLFDGKQKTLVFTASEHFFQKNNVEFIRLNFNSADFLQKAMHELYLRKISSVLIEGGASLLNSFLSMNFWDEAYIIRSSTKLINQGIEAPILSPALCQAIEQLGNDSIEHYINNKNTP